MVAVWQVEQYERCPDCGTYAWEYEEDAEAWTAGIHPCLGCKSIEELRERTVTERRGLHSEGWKLRLYRGGPEEVADGD